MRSQLGLLRLVPKYLEFRLSQRRDESILTHNAFGILSRRKPEWKHMKHH